MFSQQGKNVHVMINKHTIHRDEYAQSLLSASVKEMQGNWWRIKSIARPSLAMRMVFSCANK